MIFFRDVKIAESIHLRFNKIDGISTYIWGIRGIERFLDMPKIAQSKAYEYLTYHQYSSQT